MRALFTRCREPCSQGVESLVHKVMRALFTRWWEPCSQGDNYKQQSPRVAKSSSVSCEIARIVWNPTVDHCVHKSPSTTSYPSPYILKVYFIIIFTPSLVLPNDLFPLCVNDQRDAQFFNQFLFNIFFCLLYMFRTNLVVHQEHGIIYSITQFGTIGTTVQASLAVMKL